MLLDDLARCPGHIWEEHAGETFPLCIECARRKQYAPTHAVLWIAPAAVETGGAWDCVDRRSIGMEVESDL